MPFTLTAENLADALAPHLDVRPEVAVSGDRLVVGAPLDLKVVVEPASLPHHFDVRCIVVLNGLPLRLALMAANEATLGGSSGARARILSDEDGLNVLVESGVCGPLVPGDSSPEPSTRCSRVWPTSTAPPAA